MRTAQMDNIHTTPTKLFDTSSKKDETDNAIKPKYSNNRKVDKLSNASSLLICAANFALSLGSGIFGGIILDSTDSGLTIGASVFAVSTIISLVVVAKNYIGTSDNNQKQVVVLAKNCIVSENNRKQMNANDQAELELLRKV